MRRTSLRTLLWALAVLAAPALVLASGGESANPWFDLVLKFVNFGILAGLLFYLLRKIVPDALRDRRSSIEKELREAREAKAAAEAKLAEYRTRVANLEGEIEKIRADFKAEGEAQHQRILAEAEKAAELIKKNAASAGEREARTAVEIIKTEAVAEALAQAEKILRAAYGAEDQKKALAQTIEKIEGLH